MVYQVGYNPPSSTNPFLPHHQSIVGAHRLRGRECFNCSTGCLRYLEQTFAVVLYILVVYVLLG